MLPSAPPTTLPPMRVRLGRACCQKEEWAMRQASEETNLLHTLLLIHAQDASLLLSTPRMGVLLHTSRTQRNMRPG